MICREGAATAILSPVAVSGATQLLPSPTCCSPASTLPQGLLEILSSASEYDDVPVRPGEERVVQVRGS